jgi:signal transduction histidine kinase
MDFFALVPVAAAVVNLLLGILVASQGLKNKLNLVYCLWTLAIFLWNAGTAWAFYAKTEHEGLLAVCFLQTGVIGLPFFLYHLCAIVSNKKGKYNLYALYIACSFFMIMHITGNFVLEVRYVTNIKAYYALGGIPYIMFYVVCMLVSTSAVINLHKSYKRSSPLLRQRIQTLLFSNYLLVFFGCNDMLPIIGVYSYPFTNIQILPLGSAAAIFYGLMVGYSVLQDHLLDIRFSLGRSLANFLRASQISFIGIVILIVIILSTPKSTFNTLSIFSFTSVIIITSVIAVLFFPKIFGSVNNRFEKLILGDHFVYQDQVNLFIKTLPWYTKFDTLFEDLELLFVHTLRIEQFRIILLDDSGFGFIFFQTYPPTLRKAVLGVDSDSILFGITKETTEDAIVINKIEDDKIALCRIELQNSFETEKAEFCFPFKSDGVAYGFLLVSNKKGDDPYTRNDIKIITSLVKNLSLVINQIRLKEKLQAEQELDLLGRISKGLAHDLNNLLTPVWTLLQVSASTENNDPEITSLVDNATQNVVAMRNYIRDSLFFSKTMKPQLVESCIHELIIATLGVISPRAKEKNVSVDFDAQQRSQANVDAVLFQRMISNLIANAIDACQIGGYIKIDIQTVQRKANETSWLQIRVTDNGEGISQSNLEKMKAAFFTTKDSGDGKRGFGLGLAICRKIVHLHGGTLNITSQIGQGTTVQVDLPTSITPTLVADESKKSVITA